MENNLIIENKNNIENNIEKEQKNFLDTMIGKAVNTAIDIGIRALLPNFVEDQIVNLKDNLFKLGLKDGINKTIEDTIEMGRSAIGIVTGNFKNVSQMQNAVKEGGIIDGFSSLMDFSLSQLKKTGLINNNIIDIIKSGKSIILNNLENNIEKSFKNQLINETNITNYINDWKKEFNIKNIDGMEREYKNIIAEMKKLVPIEEKLKEAQMIGNIHMLIKNKGNDFNLSENEMELIKKLK